MPVREFNFVPGVEQATVPAADTPTDASDLVPLGYLQTYYLSSAPTSFAIANNASAASVTGLIFDKTVYRSVEIHYTIYRAATSKVVERGIIFLVTDGTTWFIAVGPSVGDSNVDFDIDTSTGQVKYTSDNMSGSYDTTNSKMKYWYSTTAI